MSLLNSETGKPVAVALAPKGGLLHALVDGLACAELDVLVVSEPAQLAGWTTTDHQQLSAFLIDTTVPEASFSECFKYVDPVFRDAGGPVIAVADSEGESDQAELWVKGATKIVDARSGRRALRLALSLEVEEFARICTLRGELKKCSSTLGTFVQGQFQFKTRREAQNLAMQLSVASPDPMPIAIGLTELFINGVEHGCLGIGHDEKGRLIEEGKLAAEIEHRRTLQEFCDRTVRVEFRREPNKLHFVINDDGEGFNYQAYLTDSEGHGKKHGRGITMANSCFGELIYKGNGSEVHAVHYFGGRKQR